MTSVLLRELRLQISDAVDQIQEGREDGSGGQSYRSRSFGAGGHQGCDQRTRHRGDAKSARNSYASSPVIVI